LRRWSHEQDTEVFARGPRAGRPVSDLASAILVAKEQAQSGSQLIELCGGFTQQEAMQVRHQLPASIPVGAVTYTAEQEAQMARLFA
jgi:hypothetical protein